MNVVPFLLHAAAVVVIFAVVSFIVSPAKQG